jgi:hypothetical protein
MDRYRNQIMAVLTELKINRSKLGEMMGYDDSHVSRLLSDKVDVAPSIEFCHKLSLAVPNISFGTALAWRQECQIARHPEVIRQAYLRHIARAKRAARPSVVCEQCGYSDHDPGALFCDQCGDTLARLCPNCDHKNRTIAKHCQKCGHSLTRKEGGATG